MKTLVASLIALAIFAGLAGNAAAHDFSPGVLVFDESAPGTYRMLWTEPVDSSNNSAGVELQIPADCSQDGAMLSCPGELGGTIAFTGMNEPRMQVVVSIKHLSGDVDEYVVTGARPSLDLGGAPGRSFLLWIRLGIEHILGGLDHLAFVLGLLLVLDLRADRRLFTTITAFTVAHSITLALATLDILRLPSAPVEATIALSVLLVAREAMHTEPTAMRKAPWIVAGIFGLVHGLGFAGALGDLGLPRESLATSLLSFNLGVELGQLAVVGVVIGAARLIGGRHPRLGLARPIACYAVGSLAAFWLIARTVLILTA